jgi:hypothetical protein
VAQKVFIKKNAEGHIEVRGDTFDIKDDLKAKLGARYVILPAESNIVQELSLAHLCYSFTLFLSSLYL